MENKRAALEAELDANDKANPQIVVKTLDGDVIPEGTPIGLMGGETAQTGAILSLSGEGGGTGRSETLYIEVRMENSPVDPTTWFRTGQGG